jgi:hypothetical protein
MACPVPFPESEAPEFWPAFLAWQGAATAEELRQLEVVLDSLQSQEVVPLAKAIQLALRDQQLHRSLPPTLLQRLQNLQWPAPHVAA